MDRIVVSDISKTFQLKPGQFVTVDGEATDRVTVLDGVDLSIRKGEFITLVGPSGSGKSVLLDIIGGLTQATGGDVKLDGRRITRPDPKTGYVFQQYALFPWRTALANIEYALEVRGVAKAERTATARHLLSLFGLAGFEDRFPNQLSGGMQQRVAIARALASNPEVLLMDEPFAALDQQTRELLQGELLRIWGKINTTVIFVTHSIDEAIFLADRVVVMTARPGAVKEIIDIDLPRPRDGDIRASAEFNLYRARVWDVLRDEVNKAQKDWTLSPAFSH
ncbi:ABC transporter ATP-binding protein [Mesorhizobium ciceri]|uniref:ABC transporter related protein n=1 Tax=Mesorhizobium ciceri biovar biserrulae (strain HAMBI 2942 / LMG 23838 / WSM1271) TaxID=765698 RepID=E8TD09_MESCW|nr:MULTISPECIES: ABC transporter ATP-binding protein [Mesorhizobium]RUZ78934.1 ABC transporter ATP-binding protein [Mesorhizobium sp. M7A.F.Ca.US.003.02.2.1]ADV12134.1 ABC transporter related protein [Mesorhizobium ciceri biovar biserrulae WSM1271]AMX93888.1 ABC transporter ATP-binding protein [Mesorhizobium ciceri]AMY01263.1 ABC transporter ATP-binding protein [Mesorhizobium ciceri biovar biserrulae]ARP64755.1 ABC transporter ATP-binding protein [Mesorhizobium sp. WSM1497]